MHAAMAVCAVASPLARTPPMGWMSWQTFRCGTDCAANPDDCIGEKLYSTTADALAGGGYHKAGYTGVHIDDCWEQTFRDASGRLAVNSTRFPSGLSALAAHIHARNLTFGIYSDEGTKTCGGYPGSKGTEAADALTFKAWGVDYLKLDGCNEDVSDYAAGYSAMGRALQAGGRPITYSCSWPAYLGDNESAKPYAAMAKAGCNLWRNWHDIQCSWSSLSSIIDHWGDYSEPLMAAAGPGHWNDPDMLLIGANVTTNPKQRGVPPISTLEPCLTLAEEQTQMAIWAIVAAPLIMGNDIRSVRPASRALLLNQAAIAVDQDPLGKAGGRLRAYNSSSPTQVWTRELARSQSTGKSRAAVALFHKGSDAEQAPPDPQGQPADIQLRFADVPGCDASATVDVHDVWTGQAYYRLTGGFVAKAVPFHGSAFLVLEW